MSQQFVCGLRWSDHIPSSMMAGALAALLLFSSCLKEEDPITPPDLTGNVETAQIPMGKNYDGQFFFDLGTNQIISSNNRTDWDLAFECGPGGYHIFLNTSKLMAAWNTEETDFAGVTDDKGAVWKWDVASGNRDSTAIGKWCDYSTGEVISYGQVYVISRGRDAFGSSYGMRKIVFTGLSNDTYSFRFAKLDGSEEQRVEIKKDEKFSFVYFSFDGGGQVKTIAPEKDRWDLAFTVYTHIFSETPDNIQQPDTLISYPVNGVLHNPAGVAVAELFGKPFAAITLEEAMALDFVESSLDMIGYDWKRYNLDEMSYVVLPDRTYIVRDTEGYLYKLQFTDFYSNTGEKGFPRFEYQRL